MPLFLKILIPIMIVMLIALVVLYFLGKKAEKKKAEQDEQIAAAAQTVSMLIIDKKMMKLKDAGLPAAVIEQTPKLMRRSKLPIVKAKVGPQIMTFICDGAIFESVPVKKEVKATVSGLYITSVRGLRGPIQVTTPKKKSFRQKMLDKANELRASANETKTTKKK